MPFTMRFPIRTKLTIATLIPLLVAIFFCFLAGAFIVNAKVAGQAQEKVRNDLNVAREAYHHEISRIKDVMKFTAAFSGTAETIGSGQRQEIAEILAPVRANEHLDLLVAVNASGKVIYRANNPSVTGDDQEKNPFVARALKGEMVAGSTVLPPVELAREGAALLRQAHITVRPTPMARDTDITVQNAGMFLMVAAPVKDRTGNVLGAIYGGVLLNNNNDLVDKIKGIVYEGVKFQGMEVGNATIFLRDLRIATNVRTSDGSRAIGTRLSDQVYRKVIVSGSRWIGRAFVVNDWYLTAYEPIVSIEGATIGALYVGMPENQYTAVKTDIALLLGGVLLVSGLIGFAISGFLGARLARPIKELEVLARRMAAGERNTFSAIVTRDEIGDLAEKFNEMSRSLTEREDRITELNKNLEQKVQRRTAELQEKNRLLVQTREELLRVEKLAAIGELAAGVAHEINNPMAIIRGNVELLQLAVPEDDPNREEVEVIFAQVKRVERIVANLLKFARREQRDHGMVKLNGLLHEIVSQIGYQVSMTDIEIIEEYDGELEVVEGDEGQLRQVFTNLILNALQAMPQGGVLTISTGAVPGSLSLQVRVSDTGNGIAFENLHQLFNPFFTTKATGTGLGLSVSYGIVKEHGGSIDVTSTEGVGSCFTVTLPGPGSSAPLDAE